MSFGQPITVERRVPIEGQPNIIRLAPIDFMQVDALFPVAPDEPGLPLLPPKLREERTHPSFEVPVARYMGAETLSWGMYRTGQLIGAAALTAELGNPVTMDMHISQAYRTLGVDEMALAGIVRATFTPDFIAQSIQIGHGNPPWRLNVDAHKKDVRLKELLLNFGFSYTRSHAPEPGFRVNSYGLIGGFFDGPADPKHFKNTLKAIDKLRQFRVTAQGAVPIADEPKEMLRRLEHRPNDPLA
ncbi:MAG TPA: hypothetical protein VLF62_01275 [Candidatus Saccharimonadales bacterium]|nr:hypothetical protein [Candidatus Saccharimonadales bacterium]